MSGFDAQAFRLCGPFDLVGTWELVSFGSLYSFKNPEAPYLYPYQVFQFAKDGALKSAHSPMIFTDTPEKILEGIPASLSYDMDPARKGMVAVKRRDRAGVASETWHCRAVTIDQIDATHHTILKRGDVVLTLLSKSGQPLFTRQLRKY